jgi:acyl-coenzyme A thioesterase PaaI-like protein
LRSICRRSIDAARAFGLAAVAAGRITLSEASAVAGLIEAHRRATGADVAQGPTVQLNISFVSPASRPEPARAATTRD